MIRWEGHVAWEMRENKRQIEGRKETIYEIYK